MRKAPKHRARKSRPAAPRDRQGRAGILRAATTEFAAKGFHGATTAAIARAAGVAQPLVHHHFASKRGLWEAVLDDLFGELRALQEGTIRELRGIDIPSSLRILLRQFVLFSARRPELARIMAIEASPVARELDPSLEAHLRPQLEILLQLLKQLLDERRVPMSAEEMKFLCSFVLGASTHPFLTAGSFRQIMGIDSLDINVAQRYADTVERVLFAAVEALSEAPASQETSPGPKLPRKRRAETTKASGSAKGR